MIGKNESLKDIRIFGIIYKPKYPFSINVYINNANFYKIVLYDYGIFKDETLTYFVQVDGFIDDFVQRTNCLGLISNSVVKVLKIL